MQGRQLREAGRMRVPSSQCIVITQCGGTEGGTRGGTTGTSHSLASGVEALEWREVGGVGALLQRNLPHGDGYGRGEEYNRRGG